MNQTKRVSLETQQRIAKRAHWTRTRHDYEPASMDPTEHETNMCKRCGSFVDGYIHELIQQRLI